MTLKEWREAEKLSMDEAAKRIGIDRTYLLRLEAGKRSASAEVMRRIREASGGQVSAEHLIALGAAS